MVNPSELYELHDDDFDVPRGLHLIAGLTGFTDSGSTISQLGNHIFEKLDYRVVAMFENDELLDYRSRRPIMFFEKDHISSYEPQVLALYLVTDEVGQKFLYLHGYEPDFKWDAFVDAVLEIVDIFEVLDFTWVHSIPFPVPHTRPIGVMSTSQNEHARQELEIERSQYEGPVGILSVLGIELEKAGIPAVALWASVPHYVHNTPSPKATLSLLIEVERLLGVQFDHGKLGEEAFAWERGIDEIAEGDDEMSNYISQLEKTRDEVESPAASGESLAKEFEKFLRAENKDAPEGSNDSEDEN